MTLTFSPSILDSVFSHPCCKHCYFLHALSQALSIAPLSVLGEGSVTCASLRGFWVFYFGKSFCVVVFPHFCWELRTEEVTSCQTLRGKLWFVNMGYTNTFWMIVLLIDWYQTNLPNHNLRLFVHVSALCLNEAAVQPTWRFCHGTENLLIKQTRAVQWRYSCRLWVRRDEWCCYYTPLHQWQLWVDMFSFCAWVPSSNIYLCWYQPGRYLNHSASEMFAAWIIFLSEGS